MTPDDEERFWNGRDPRLTALYWFLGAYLLVGSGGGLWYLLHRTAQFLDW